MSYGTTHNLDVAARTNNGTATQAVTLAPINLTNAIAGYTYNRDDRVMITVADMSPGNGEFNSSTRSIALASSTKQCNWGARNGRATTSAFFTATISDSGVISFTLNKPSRCRVRGKQPYVAWPQPGEVSISILPVFRNEGLPAGDLTWVYINQPDLTTRGITTGQPPDLVALEIQVEKEDVYQWSYQLGEQGFDKSTNTYGGEFNVNRGSVTQVYQVRQGSDVMVLQGKDSAGNVLISKNGNINT